MNRVCYHACAFLYRRQSTWFSPRFTKHKRRGNIHLFTQVWKINFINGKLNTIPTLYKSTGNIFNCDKLIPHTFIFRNRINEVFTCLFSLFIVPVFAPSGFYLSCVSIDVDINESIEASFRPFVAIIAACFCIVVSIEYQTERALSVLKIPICITICIELCANRSRVTLCININSFLRVIELQCSKRLLCSLSVNLYGYYISLRKLCPVVEVAVDYYALNVGVAAIVITTIVFGAAIVFGAGNRCE